MKYFSALQTELLLVFFLVSGISLSAVDTALDLDISEISWLENHDSIRVSNEEFRGPFSFNEDGVPRGFSIDYMNLVAEILDIRVDFISNPGKNELVEMLEAGDLDVLLDMTSHPQYQHNLYFTNSYNHDYVSFFFRRGHKLQKLQDLFGKTIAVPENYIIREFLEEYSEILILDVKNAKEAVIAVSSGNADALFESHLVIRSLLDELKISNVISGEISELSGLDHVSLRMAVLNNQGTLRDLLAKAMEAVNPEDLESLRNHWLDNKNDSRTSGFGAGEKADSMNLFLKISLILILIILAFAGALLFLGRVTFNAETLNLRRIRFFSFVGLGVFILVTLLFAKISFNQINYNHRQNLVESLRSKLSITNKAVDIWIGFNISMIVRDSNNEIFARFCEELLDAGIGTEADEKRQVLIDYIAGSLKWMNEETYQIIDTDYIVIASNEENLIGTPSTLHSERKEDLDRVFEGDVSYIFPLHAKNLSDKSFSIHYLASPIRNSEGDVIAAIVRNDDPADIFSDLTRMGRLGNTGETYAFDSQGHMISSSRYIADLQRLGLLGLDETSVFNFVIKDPGGNLTDDFIPELSVDEMPLTLMASFATNGLNGLSAESYRDYRGVPVFGSWRWKPNYNFGIVAEIDVEDGMQYFYSIRNSLIALLSVTVLLAVGMTLVSLSLSNKAHIALSESRAGLEEKVINRTRELSMANRNLNNTIEALTHPFYVIDAKTYEIVLANKTAIEQGAKGAGTCYALTHFSEKICSGIDHECPLDRVMKTKKPYVTEHLHRDRDGKERFVEVHGYPILDENSEVVQMIEYNLDITDRKIAEIKIKDNEKRLQSLLEAGPDGMIIIDENHLISQVNMQTERIFGYQRDELVGKSLEILVPQLGENERDKIWNGNLGSNFETKERSTLELFAQRMDGSSFPIDISMSPIRTIEGMFMVTSVRDITVRKDTELTMKQNIEELELFNKLTIGREEKMIELKGEINELLKQFDMPEKYIIVTDEDEA